MRHQRLHPCRSGLSIFFVPLVLGLLTVFVTSCGSNGNSLGSSTAPKLSGNTSVTLLLSSTANDQLSEFNIAFTSITLTSQSGKIINLYKTAAPLLPDFIHVNGNAEPWVTVTVPQDIYTSATATIGGSSFTCETLTSSGSLDTSTYAYGATPSSQVTVNLPTPITVTGAAMGLSLDMQVSQSASYPGTCYPVGIAQYSITPSFNLTPAAFSPQLAETSLDGQVSAVNASGGGFTIVLADGQSLSVNTSSNTVYQGINGFSLLSVGTFVDMDAAIKTDGSQWATRIAVEDTDTTNLSVSIGPLLQTAASQPTLFGFERQHQGFLTTSGLASVFMPYNFGNAIFQISGRLTNLTNLPFPATFNAFNMFDGQNVYITSHATTVSGGPTYVPAATVTLMPQIINGTINGTSSDGGFTTYTIALAPYDLIPSLAVQQGQTTVLTDPSSVVVYVDGNTQMRNTMPLAAGSVLRFDGLIFNDNGTLRMDCSQVNDGVPE